MKKYLLTCLALVALFSCKKETPTPSKGEITLSTPAAVTLTSKDTAVTVQFKSTAKWTAATTAAEDVAMISPKSGDAAQTATVNVAVSENTGEAARSFDLTLTPEGGDPVKVTFTQAAKEAAPFFNVIKPEIEVTEVLVGGGEYDIVVETNTDFDYEDYSGEGKAFPWQKLTPASDGKSFKLKIAANTGFDPRQSYVKFTVPAIQDPKLDDNDDPIPGEFVAHTVRVYFNQAGTAVVESAPIPAVLSDGATRFSMAMFGRDMLISNGAGVFLGSNADNSVTKIIPREDLPFTPTGITNDDAGNVVISIGGKTQCAVDDSTLILAYVPKDADASQLAYHTKVIGCWRNNIYGFGVDNLRVKGNVADASGACITLSSAAGGDTETKEYSSSFGVAFDFTGPGAPFGDWSVSITPTKMVLPTGMFVWSSANLVTYPLGSSISDGFYYIGYDNNYNLHYLANAADAEDTGDHSAEDAWQTVFETGSTWIEGYNAMDIIDVDGHKLCAFVGMTYFPDYGPSWLFIMDVTDPANVQLISKHPLPIGTATSSLTTDVILIPEATALVAFVIDGGTGMMSKVTYPEPEL